jgi:hypothetical protein
MGEGKDRKTGDQTKKRKDGFKMEGEVDAQALLEIYKEQSNFT